MRNLYVDLICLVTMFWINGISSTKVLTVAEGSKKVLTVAEGSTVNLVCPPNEYSEYQEQLAKAHIDYLYLKSKGYSFVTVSR